MRASDVPLLTPTSPRAEDKAMTIGQRIEASTNRAFWGSFSSLGFELG